MKTKTIKKRLEVLRTEYFPEDVQDAVLQHMEKYDLDDVTQGW